MQTIDQDIRKRIERACEEVRIFLPSADVEIDRGRKIVQRYTAAIEGNFVSWMGAAAISARSPQGRFAATENLWVEMEDNHAGMLHNFAKKANALPESGDFEYVDDAVTQIRLLVAEMSGLKNLVLMATLENTSATFVPLLEQYAKKLGSDDLTYVKIHGEADIEHADQFVWAVQHEIKFYRNTEQDVNETIATTLEFLRHIFN